jgi:hypothetical protein
MLGTAPAAPMDRDTAIDLLDRLHQAQNEFYAGAVAPLQERGKDGSNAS